MFYRKTNFDAAEAAYTLMEPYQALLEGDTLEEVIDPGNKLAAGVEETPAADASPVGEPIVTTANAPEEAFGWVKGFLSSTCLVWGNQGSGKSWFVRYLARLKKEKGYRVIVFDPNSNRSEWMGVELYNSYAHIEEQIAWYVEEVMRRYEQFGKTEMSEETWRKRLWQNGQAVSIICEEMTTYTDFITDKELLAKFVKVATTLSRKQEMPVTFIAHNNTQSCMGDIKGLSNLVSRMQQIQLIPATDLNTAQPTASGKALIKLDGSDQWQEVLTPRLEGKIKDFRGEADKRADAKAYLEKTWNLEFALEKPEGSLSQEAQKALNWLNRKQKDGLEWISAEQCRASGCVKDAKTGEIRQYFEEIARANKGVLNERGDIRIT